ncbi:hypothetical protein DXD09_00130 [Ligilactobacillus ruminis]|uniref:Uncharacterized protein n=1 Tax=Ligilactobacillus ruminis TaxID=1623 RepID=A0A8B2Z108_9LACO|nr:hypothetical protein DXD09_00130 [Ligilactobacillus ruminis]
MRSWINQFSSTAFKKAGQSQSQIDRLRSAFRLTQIRNGTFFPASFLYFLTISQYLFFKTVIIACFSEPTA